MHLRYNLVTALSPAEISSLSFHLTAFGTSKSVNISWQKRYAGKLTYNTFEPNWKCP